MNLSGLGSLLLAEVGVGSLEKRRVGQLGMTKRYFEEREECSSKILDASAWACANDYSMESKSRPHLTRLGRCRIL